MTPEKVAMKTREQPQSECDKPTHNGMKFGQFLISQEKVTQEELSQALEQQRKSGRRLGENLVDLRVLTEVDMLQSLADYLHIPFLPMTDLGRINREIARSIPESITRRFALLPVAEEENTIHIVMADPLDVLAIDTVMMRLKRHIQPCLAPRQRILEALEAVYHGSDLDEQRLLDLTEKQPEEEVAEIIPAKASDPDNSESAEDVNDAPVVRFVDLLLRQAVKSQASDIHIEPEEDTTGIRMRIDGKLREMVPPSNRMRTAVIARIKILSGMNIAEKRLPQDGRLKIEVSGRAVDVRVSVLPVIHGEKVVMRILDGSATGHDLSRLGLAPDQFDFLKNTLALPHGIVMVTGPTGSGKSTTLYAALNNLKDTTKNITTVEDPVEYQLKGINQIQIRPEIGLDFASSLRTILRQDPDIILIGEIRDKETVDIAIKASLTGHLVLSTFHTNDTPSTISRLAYMGVDRYLLASTLNLVIAQRLVRRICEDCAEPDELPSHIIEKLKLSPTQLATATISRGRGCNRCAGTGYKGRLPIFEFLPIGDEMRELIINCGTESQLRKLAKQDGYGVLLDSGIRSVLAGKTTAEEIIAVAYTAHSP